MTTRSDLTLEQVDTFLSHVCATHDRAMAGAASSGGSGGEGSRAASAGRKGSCVG